MATLFYSSSGVLNIQSSGKCEILLEVQTLFDGNLNGLYDSKDYLGNATVQYAGLYDNIPSQPVFFFPMFGEYYIPYDDQNHALTAALNPTPSFSSLSSFTSHINKTPSSPLTTSVLTVILTPDTGLSATDLITNTAAQTISGTLSAATVVGETVEVSLNNGAVGSWVTASNTTGQNTWSLTGQTLTASNTLQARVTNTGGE